MRDVVIVSGVRTPVGAFGGTLKDTPVVQLGALVLKEALKRVGLRPLATDGLTQFEPDIFRGKGMVELEKEAYDYDDSLQPVQIDEVIMGNVVGAGQGQNVARQAMIKAGISKETNAFTVNKVCASGMKAVALATQSIRSGEAEVILAGGMENMSLIPYALPAGRWGARMNNVDLVDLMVFDGLYEIFYGYHMGITAENIAEQYGISREEQDELGAQSHQRARKAIADGLFKEEIVPVVIPQRKGEAVVFDTDERPMETSAAKMAKLRPAFRKDGTVTAGNASGINDAAAALLLMSGEKAKDLGLSPLVKVRAYASGGVDPRCDMEKTNPLGSGISIGHPIGCTGARIVVTLMGEMLRKEHALGLAALCIGGGQGMATVLEKT